MLLVVCKVSTSEWKNRDHWNLGTFQMHVGFTYILLGKLMIWKFGGPKFGVVSQSAYVACFARYFWGFHPVKASHESPKDVGIFRIMPSLWKQVPKRRVPKRQSWLVSVWKFVGYQQHDSPMENVAMNLQDSSLRFSTGEVIPGALQAAIDKAKKIEKAGRLSPFLLRRNFFSTWILGRSSPSKAGESLRRDT